ncbi:54S ribosomal protein L4 mitochondrial, partial [Blyttiomyces sp. JEL0837]
FQSGNPIGLLELDRAVFGAPVRQDLLHRALRYEEAWRLQGTESSKALGQVRGTTRKPFPQKGRGKARQGTLRAPQFVGGYAVHGPRPHKTSFDIQQKVYDSAIRTAISSKFAQEQLLVVDKLSMEGDSKSLLEEIMHQLSLQGKGCYFIYGNAEPERYLIRAADKFTNKRASEELPAGERKLLVSSAKNISVTPILEKEILVIDKAGIEVLEEMYHVD